MRDGESVTIDAERGKLELQVSDAELEHRRSEWIPPTPRYTTGVLAKYARLVSSAELGAVTDRAT